MNLSDVERKASQSQSELIELKQTVKLLEARVERQALVLEALKDYLLGTDADAAAAYSECLHAATARKEADKSCVQCGRAVNPRLPKCMYCGTPRATDSL